MCDGWMIWFENEQSKIKARAHAEKTIPGIGKADEVYIPNASPETIDKLNTDTSKIRKAQTMNIVRKNKFAKAKDLRGIINAK